MKLSEHLHLKFKKAEELEKQLGVLNILKDFQIDEFQLALGNSRYFDYQFPEEMRDDIRKAIQRISQQWHAALTMHLTDLASSKTSE